jgi:hypothetical protein
MRISMRVVAIMVSAAVMIWGCGKGTQGTEVAPGRWQIVNVASEQSKSTVLLDSATGDTWVACEGEKGSLKWCYRPRVRSGEQ